MLCLLAKDADDIRNGLALTQTLHWAFDRGLFGISPKRTVYISRKVKLTSENAFLKQFDNKPILVAKTEIFRVHNNALPWHFENVVNHWT